MTGADATGLERWNGAQSLRLAVATDGSHASEAAYSWIRTSGFTTSNDISLVRVYWPPQEAAHYGLEEPWLGHEGHPDLVRLLERDLRRDAQALMGASEPPRSTSTRARVWSRQLRRRRPRPSTRRFGTRTPVPDWSAIRCGSPISCTAMGAASHHGLVDMNGDGFPEILGACRQCTPATTKGYYQRDPQNPTAPWVFYAVTVPYTFPKARLPVPEAGVSSIDAPIAHAT